MTWTLQDAKNRFSAVVAAALDGTPQEVSRRGKPAVIVLSVAQYRHLAEAAGREAGSFREHLLDFPGGDALPDEFAERGGARPRDVQF